IFHWHLIQKIDNFCEQSRRRNREPRVAHVVRVSGFIAPKLSQKREYVFADQLEHVLRREILEPRPPIILIRPRVARVIIFSFRKDASFHRLLRTIRLQLLSGMQIVEPFQEEQISNLLDYLEWVGDSSAPKRVPNPIDLIANFARQHEARRIAEV